MNRRIYEVPSGAQLLELCCQTAVSNAIEGFSYIPGNHEGVVANINIAVPGLLEEENARGGLVFTKAKKLFSLMKPVSSSLMVLSDILLVTERRKIGLQLPAVSIDYFFLYNEVILAFSHRAEHTSICKHRRGSERGDW